MRKPPPVPKFGLAIDWETSGYSLPNYAANHQGITFGAIIFEVATLKAVESIYREIQFDDKYQWSAEAQGVHGLSKDYLAAHGVSQAQAAVDLGNLIMKYIATDKVVLLGHRVYFDQAFTDQLMATIDIELTYDPIRIDSAAIALTFLNVTSSDQLFDMCGLPPRTLHNSGEDIDYTLRSVRYIKEKFKVDTPLSI